MRNSVLDGRTNRYARPAEFLNRQFAAASCPLASLISFAKLPYTIIEHPSSGLKQLVVSRAGEIFIFWADVFRRHTHYNGRLCQRTRPSQTDDDVGPPSACGR